MSTQDYEVAIASARRVLANVTADQLSQPTPCREWDVAGLINHLVGGQLFFATVMEGAEFPSDQEDAARGEFVRAFDENAARAVRAFSEPGVLEKTYKLPFGEMPGFAFLGLATTDTFTHAWDLAKATGQSTDLAPALATSLLEANRASLPDAVRNEQGNPFAPATTAPPDASKADELAAFLGRAV